MTLQIYNLITFLTVRVLCWDNFAWQTGPQAMLNCVPTVSLGQPNVSWTNIECAAVQKLRSRPINKTLCNGRVR